jgi:catechol 2,3-dioxygenase
MTIATEYFDMKAAPVGIRSVRLKVRDLGAVSAFYQSVIGLTPIENEGCRITFGTRATRLLELVSDPSLALHDPRQAGLFHTALLMPSRADLARWLGHAAAARVPIQGTSDHTVSEAIYLADPEGNGIEIYADRPVSHWRGTNGEIRMSSTPLDIPDLLQAAGETAWSSFPDGGIIGHVHLRVGDTEEADRFYRDVLGFDISRRRPGASFYGSGGYHHQLAGNVWNSRGARARPGGITGLDAVELVVRDQTYRDAIAHRAEAAAVPVAYQADTMTLRDPWGTRITITP